MKQFVDAIQDRLSEMSENAFSIEQKAGLPPDAIRNLIAKDPKYGPRLSRVKEICDALGLELYFGPRRDDPPKDFVNLSKDRFVSIPRFDVQFSAGPGTEATEQVVEHLAFKRDWFTKMGVSPNKAMLVGIRDNSMEPCLHSGDLALIDGGRTTIKSRKVYAFRDADDQLRVKRLEWVDGDRQLILRSDNPDYDTEIRSGTDLEKIEVFGQLAWSAHSWTLD